MSKCYTDLMAPSFPIRMFENKSGKWLDYDDVIRAFDSAVKRDRQELLEKIGKLDRDQWNPKDAWVRLKDVEALLREK